MKRYVVRVLIDRETVPRRCVRLCLGHDLAQRLLLKRFKLPLGGSDVVLVGFKVTVLAKIGDYPAPTEGATWAVENLLNLLKRCGGAGSSIRARCDPQPARPLANRLYLTACCLWTLFK
jgi:hypothetical protein